MVKVLFVCMGNICRSPVAHGLFQHLLEQEGLAEQVHVDSAGTHAYHIGEQPDPRSQDTARRRGIDISTQRARKVCAEDFDEFDYVLAMDRGNYQMLADICPAGSEEKLSMFLSFDTDLQEIEVPDPYYGGPGGFERVFDLVEAAARGLLADIRKRHGVGG
ncbi:low molecular weight protein-tyrosine-phosphatase [Thiohalomonas denitrificans]|uniref:protein-tyrosine-phosphatase n=1 Tax=Thiohalomonas denitrificans TaxID=415747 RepID=A0A1G5R1G7_9GAMM|nr:low molecular weight protein-tyrosine-phosphatase [Thiohalomonas denitrificans]SCZ67786.1 protein-tyrosine phosphatase [Thiohalomonas denitrificans]